MEAVYRADRVLEVAAAFSQAAVAGGGGGGGKKHDLGKVRVSLIPARVRAVALETGRRHSGQLELARYLETELYEFGLSSVCWLLGADSFSAGLLCVAEVMEHGVGKYGEENWRLVTPIRYIDAAWRHLAACADDPTAIDPDSGLTHLAHLGANFAILAALA